MFDTTQVNATERYIMDVGYRVTYGLPLPNLMGVNVGIALHAIAKIAINDESIEKAYCCLAGIPWQPERQLTVPHDFRQMFSKMKRSARLSNHLER